MSTKEEENAWKKVAGNAGIAFFTTLAGVSIVGVPAGQAIVAALVPAVIQAGLTFCRGLVDEGSKGFAFMSSVTLF